MKNRKSGIMKVLLAVVIMSLSFAILTGCDSDGGGSSITKGKLELENWTDTTEQVTLGDCYEVKTETAKDASGKEYDVTVKVYKVSNGKEVALIKNQFDVTEKTGYRIVYTASTETKENSKTITLTVNDTSAPVVIINGDKIAEVSKKYLYPEFNITDDSGVIASVTTEVYKMPENEKVDSDALGFTPSKTGDYELRVRAKDVAGNEGESKFGVYARNTLKTYEIDSFDDKGLELTAYSKSGTQKMAAEFIAFKSTTISQGSAMFKSGTDEKTGIYFQPRKNTDEIDALDEKGYISVKFYIADSTYENRNIYYGNKSAEFAVNEWSELMITSAEVGNYLRFYSNLTTYNRPLFEVENGRSDYLIFIDEIKVAKTDGIELSGIKSEYSVGEAVEWTANDSNAVVETIIDGIPQRVTNGFIPENQGEYKIYAYKPDGAEKIAVKTFNVGTATISLNVDDWFIINKPNALPVTEMKKGTETLSNSVNYSIFDFTTGTKTAVVGETFSPTKNMFAMVAESEVDGKTVSVFRVISANKYKKDMYYGFDNPDEARASVNNDGKAFYHETYEGENGVMEFKLGNDSAESFISCRSLWRAVFTKEHYEQYDNLVFRIRAEEEFTSFCYIDEIKWNVLPVISGSMTTGKWLDISIPIKDVLDDFSGFNTTWMFYICGTKGASFYITDMFCTKKAEIPKDMWFGFDGENCAVSGSEWLETYEEETGVLKFDLTVDTSGSGRFAYNRTGWGAAFEKEHYLGAEKIVFRVKTESANPNVKVRMAYIGEEPWTVADGTVEAKVGDGWIDYEIDFKKVYDNFENFSERWSFWIIADGTAGYDAADGTEVSFYISKIYVKGFKTPDETNSIGVLWDNAWY